MIIGIGQDICLISRIAASVERFGRAFTEQFCRPEEVAWAERTAYPIAAYARILSAKEAIGKALGVGMGEILFWDDIELNIASALRTKIAIHDDALGRLHNLRPGALRIHLSWSLRPPLVSTLAVAESRELAANISLAPVSPG
ncbi:MAG: holo-ACP synthase [Henriciella sp.]|uniref:holo-ACP synthase n=1 Tax=Henriciella sp. TaxID=1968823 RepID=UPI003C7515CC